ncbi:phenylpyruvate tautomerase MIF-related protein [Sandaracinus amylolyticus]|uniref:phenylpyruvate tautomerase MIF-related protein n=1 Tax=Sandaracinus amylolyticus TaxID=927083 RepID=UPI001F2E5B9B|nr:phenylpyruvate tautomerase MIF-related protein [Sandaracinus amylolyticus]UJR78342.1 Macrophage migration inhibitory factor (MIF) [Sandaracinus amylolyticus]
MPYLRIECNRALSDDRVAQLQKELTNLVHEIKGDPVAMISTVILQSVPVSFGGDPCEPSCIVTLTNAVMPPATTSALTRALTAALGASYGVPPNRMYIFFQQFSDPTLVGWNGVTFDQVIAPQKKEGAR